MTGATIPPGDVIARACRWAGSVIGEAIELTEVLPATSSTVLAVSSTKGRAFVVRCFTNREWLAEEPDLAEHEAAALLAAETVDLPTPRLVAVDAGGADAGLPSVMMTRLPGSVWLPAQPGSAWIEELVVVPLEVAAANPTGLRRHYDPWLPESLQIPAPDRDVWERAAGVVAGGLPEAKSVMLHRDHHPTNLLFSAGRLSGVVDWVNACVGPQPVDVAHCRLNLAAMYGMPPADELRDRWRTATGLDYDPTWDLVTALSMLPLRSYPPWAEFGLAVGDRDVADRITALVGRALAEIGG